MIIQTFNHFKKKKINLLQSIRDKAEHLIVRKKYLTNFRYVFFILILNVFPLVECLIRTLVKVVSLLV